MYTDYYGLSEQPFGLTPDARFYYASAGHRKAMAYLGYGLAQGEGFIVITGEIGAGKSTLVQHLMATIDPLRVTVKDIGQTQVGADDVLRLAAQAFGLATGDATKAALLQRFEDFLRTQARGGRKTLLIVDEAQALDLRALEELRLLSNFAENGRALLQIVLLGQPEFRDRLQRDPALEQLRQRVIAQHHLDAMPLGDVEPYLVHRLGCVGWSGRPRFEPAAIAAIHAASAGLPRRLNILANRLLLHGAIEGRDVLDEADVRAVTEEIGARVTADDPAAPRAEAEPAPAPAIEDAHFEPLGDAEGEADAANEWFLRVEMIEARLDEQDAAIRRMLALMLDWTERAPQAGKRAA